MSPIAAPQPIAVGGPTEFEAIYRHYAPVVYRTAWCVVRSPEDAEDVVQAVFLRLLRNDGLPPLRKDPQAYFYKAALNASLDVLKARRRRPILVGDAADPAECLPARAPFYRSDSTPASSDRR